MIAVWMIYSIATSLLVVSAGLAVERLCLSLRRTTRWVWAGGLALSLFVSTNNWRLLHARAAADAGSWTTVIGGAPSSSVVVAGDRSVERGPAASPPTAWALRLGAERTIAAMRRSLAFDPSRFDSLGGPLLVVWLATSAAALLYLAAAVAGMRRLRREMAAGVIDGHRVLISRNIGPALIGVVRPRIVLPRWAAELCETERRLVLAHESEHAAAGDPLLLIAGVVLVAIQAWNLPLWFAVARLRFSIESDCDARVLERSGDARSYGRLLVRVHMQSAPIFAARLAFTGTTSRLESRIRRLLGARRPRRLASAVLAAICLAIVSAAASFVPTPVKGPRASAARAAVPTRLAAAADAAPTAELSPTPAESSIERTSPVARHDSADRPLLETRPPSSGMQAALDPPSGGLGCGTQTEGFFGPTFAALRQAARERYPALFDQVQTTATVIAFAIDGTGCTIDRDTVLTIPSSGSYSANVLYARAFPELPEHSPEIGLGDAREREATSIRGNPALMILYALTNVPRERASCTGPTAPSNSICSIDGEVIVRVMDSVRVLVATENHLFMFTSAEPLADIHSATIRLGHVEYAGGAVRVLRWNPEPTIVLSVRNGGPSPFDGRPGRRYENGLGLSHYTPAPVPLDAVGRLKVAPCPDSDAPVGSCFEADGRLIRFPR